MKKLGKIAAIAASSALALTMGIALAGCGGTNYTLEAEDAVLAQGLQLQTGPEWTGTDEEGEEATVVSYFSTAGQTITWNIKASKACTAKLSLRASSCAYGVIDDAGLICGINEVFQGGAPEGFNFEAMNCHIAEVKGDDCGVVLTVNDTEVALAGSLPSTTLEGGMDAMMQMFAVVHFGNLTSKVKLNEGDNTIVLKVVTSGFNVDSLTLNCGAEISFEKTDNSGIGSQN